MVGGHATSMQASETLLRTSARWAMRQALSVGGGRLHADADPQKKTNRRLAPRVRAGAIKPPAQPARANSDEAPHGDFVESFSVCHRSILCRPTITWPKKANAYITASPAFWTLAVGAKKLRKLSSAATWNVLGILGGCPLVGLVLGPPTCYKMAFSVPVSAMLS